MMILGVARKLVMPCRGAAAPVLRPAAALRWASFTPVDEVGPNTEGKPQVGLVGICEDRNSSHLRGPALAPPLIREAMQSHAYNGHTELGFDVRPLIVDYGDVAAPGEHSHDALYEVVRERVHAILADGRVPVSLGGDHSVTYPLIKAFQEYRKKPLCLVHFDAHPDIYHAFEGDPYSHASPFARIMEKEEPRLCDKLLQIGVRTVTPHQRNQMRKFQSRTVDARHFPTNGNDMRTVYDTYLPEDAEVYLSIDMDVLDPAYAPGVSHREGGGLSARQLLDAVFSIPRPIIGADVVEYNVEVDIDDVTAAATAKVVQEVIGQVIESNYDTTALKEE